MQLMTAIELEHRLRYDPDGRTNLFRSGTEQEVFPGSVLAVEQITSRSNPRKTCFRGILRDVRKLGISTSISLESIILGTQVTMRFMIYSPMITKIQVLKRAQKGQVTDQETHITEKGE